MRNAECEVRSEHYRPGRTVIAVFALMLGTLLFVQSCSKGKQGPPRTVPVIAEAAEKRNIPLQIKAIGTIEPFNTVSIRSQVSGEIAEVLFQEGQHVRKGSPLFKIDARPFEAALRQAEAALARDRAQAANAQEEARRYAALLEKHFISRQEYDRSRTNADALDAVVKADEAAVENARLQLEYTSITSPINGRTGSIAVRKGNIVKANDVTLVTINQIVPVLAAFSVPEQDFAALKRYRTAKDLLVEANISQSTQKPVRGTLTFIDNAVNTATGTILLKALFTNHDHSLWPGQFVDVIVTLTTEKDRIVVPSQAVQTGQQGQYVYVVKEDMTAELRVVSAGRTYENRTVIEKGVAAGERIVTDGHIRLAPGAKVEIKNAAPERENVKDGHGNTGAQGQTSQNGKSPATQVK